MLFRSDDHGDAWQPNRGILEHPTPDHFGTQSGSFFALTKGERWVEAVRRLLPILSVEVTPWHT